MGICCSSESENKNNKSKDESKNTVEIAEDTEQAEDNNRGREPTYGKPNNQSNAQPKASSSHTRVLRVKCHHVYDGDTLTLDDNDAAPDERTRVRLVMVDAPELKEKEEGAADAKALLEKLCPKKCALEIEVDTREERDKYGRLIGLVWVVDKDGKRVAANAELISNGVCSFYQPKGSLAFGEIAADYLALQDAALKNRRGVWKRFVDDEVYKTRNGGSYHTKNCENVKDFKLDQVKRSECIKQGLSGCRTCHP